ncbi:hypothetical protein AVEN_134844-1 [Araneus ventricosus]|uniref:Uncharacterized protein n=1 Tax=Araneus ventricosus TaxID=182803 RepID=A0A4Y2RQV4_ARAVE|nr:hypothetical protein AVEN_134844-1 [Araneus ventricosus]
MYVGPLHSKSYFGAKRPPSGVMRKFGEGMPAQASSSSSDRVLRLRGPPQKNHRVAAKWDVNITMLKQCIIFHRCSITLSGHWVVS